MTTENNVPATIELTPLDDGARNKLIVPIQRQDYQRDLSDLGLSFDSTDEEILETIRPVLVEVFDKDIKDDRTGWIYKIHRAEDRHNIYVIPNSEAG